MNAAALALVPLRATVAGTRWYAAVVMGLMLVVCVTLQLSVNADKASLLPSMISAYGEFFAGMLFVAPFLLLAIDMRQLRVPHSQLTIMAGMLIYSVSWIALPTVALTAIGAHFQMVLAMQTVGLLMGLTFGLLPRVCLIFAGFSPSFLSLMQVHLHYFATPKVLWLVAAVLTLVSAFCWRRHMHSADPYVDGFNRPLALRSRSVHRSGVSNWSNWSAWPASSQQIRAQPRWLQSVANLRHTGPDHPLRSLRVAVGGWLLPKTWQSMSRQWMVVLLPFAALVLFLYVRAPEAVSSLLHSLGWSMIIWLTGFGSMCLALTTVTLLQQRWVRTNAELPLLALLPKLGNGKSLDRHLLRANLLPTMFWQLMLFAVLLTASFVNKANGLSVLISASIQIIALIFTPAFALSIFGGRPPSQWVAGLIGGVSFAVVGCTTAMSALFGFSRTFGFAASFSIMTVLLGFLAFLVWLGVRGWHGLQERPHPFLAN